MSFEGRRRVVVANDDEGRSVVWVNRYPETAAVAFVLVDASPFVTASGATLAPEYPADAGHR